MVDISGIIRYLPLALIVLITFITILLKTIKSLQIVKHDWSLLSLYISLNCLLFFRFIAYIQFFFENPIYILEAIILLGEYIGCYTAIMLFLYRIITSLERAKSSIFKGLRISLWILLLILFIIYPLIFFNTNTRTGNIYRGLKSLITLFYMATVFILLAREVKRIYKISLFSANKMLVIFIFVWCAGQIVNCVYYVLCYLYSYFSNTNQIVVIIFLKSQTFLYNFKKCIYKNKTFFSTSQFAENFLKRIRKKILIFKIFGN